MIEYYKNLCSKYPIISIEDGLDENDWNGWSDLFNALGDQVQLVGDDLTVTNPIRLQKAIDNKSMNAILIKLNQIGTITETVDTISMARKENFGSIFKIVNSGNMDIDKLTYMIEMVKKIENNKISEYNASVEVGKVLVKDFITDKK